MNERFELKYILSPTLNQVVLDTLRAKLRPDAHAHSTDGSYNTVSLYWDTLNLRCYRDKLAGLSRRFKARVRLYKSDDADPHLHFEIKWRRGDLIAKQRQVLPRSQCLGPSMGLDRAGHFGNLVLEHHLQPTLLIAYKRYAFGDPNSSLRVTLDGQMRYGADPRRALWGKSAIASSAILEIKGGRDLPLWLHALLRDLGVKRQSFSKYCEAIQRDIASQNFEFKKHHRTGKGLMRDFVNYSLSQSSKAPYQPGAMRPTGAPRPTISYALTN